MRVTSDVERGAWLRSRLGEVGTRDGTVGSGFDAYARILHPPTRTWREPDPSTGSVRFRHAPFSWTETARIRGAVAHPWVQWGGIAGVLHREVDLGDGTSVSPPREGELSRRQLEALLGPLAATTTTPDDVTACVWEGWSTFTAGATARFTAGGPPPAVTMPTPADLDVSPDVERVVDEGPLLELPLRRYVVLEGPLADLGGAGWKAAAGLGDDPVVSVPAPQLLWSSDHAWCVASEIDFDSTLVGGSRALIDAVVAAPSLEAFELDRNGDLTSRGDVLNPPFDA